MSYLLKSRFGKLMLVTALITFGYFFGNEQATVHADSPITSTAIYKAYLDVDRVVEAKDNGLSESVVDFLSSKGQPLDQKAAVINALYSDQVWSDWNIADQYSLKVYGQKSKALDEDKLSGDELFVIGYLEMLDHYMTPDVSRISAAREELPDSLTVALIHTLAVSQGNSMCSWNNMEEVLADKDLKKDLRQDAVDIIVEYMVLYKGSPCQSSTQEQTAVRSLADDIMKDAIILSIGQASVLAKGTQTTIDDANSSIVPYLRDGATMVPLRFITDRFGAAVHYDSKKHEVTIQSQDQKIIFNEANSTISVNGLSASKNTVIESKKGRMFVPLRVIMDVFDKKIYYHRGLIIITEQIVLDPLNAQDQQAADYIRQQLLPAGSSAQN